MTKNRVMPPHAQQCDVTWVAFCLVFIGSCTGVCVIPTHDKSSSGNHGYLPTGNTLYWHGAVFGYFLLFFPSRLMFFRSFSSASQLQLQSDGELESYQMSVAAKVPFSLLVSWSTNDNSTEVLRYVAKCHLACVTPRTAEGLVVGWPLLCVWWHTPNYLTRECMLVK